MEWSSGCTTSNPFAVIIAGSTNYLPAINAFLNSFSAWGNKADFYIIHWFIHGHDSIFKEWENAFDFPVYAVPIASIDELYKHPKEEDGVDKSIVYRLMFNRWYFAFEIGKRYQAVMVVDADQFCNNNIMKYFHVAHDTGLFLVPDNPMGYELDQYESVSIDAIAGAASPPLMSVPAIFDANEYQTIPSIMNELEFSLNKYDDICIRFRAMHISGDVRNVLQLPNMYWVQTVWADVDLTERNVNCTHALYHSKTRINMVHGKWWNQYYIDMELGRVHPDVKDKCSNVLNKFKAYYYYWNMGEHVKVKFDPDPQKSIHF